MRIKTSMVRPRKKVIKSRVNLSLSPHLLEAASTYAYERNESLSSLVERLLVEAMTGNPGTGQIPSGYIQPPLVELQAAEPPAEYQAVKKKAGPAQAAKASAKRR